MTEKKIDRDFMEVSSPSWLEPNLVKFSSAKKKSLKQFSKLPLVSRKLFTRQYDDFWDKISAALTTFFINRIEEGKTLRKKLNMKNYKIEQFYNHLNINYLSRWLNAQTLQIGLQFWHVPMIL